MKIINTDFMQNLIHKNIFAFSFGLILFSLSLLAQESSVNPNSIDEPLPKEITVTGERSLKALRFQIQQAEVDMYDIFNKINDDKKFKVVCKKERPLGTKIRKLQTCHPNYYFDATGAESAAMLSEMRGEASFRGNSAEAVIAQYNAIFEEKIKQAVINNPEFVKAIQNFNELKSELKTEHD